MWHCETLRLLLLATLAVSASPDGGYPVTLDGHMLFTIKAPRQPFSAEERAKNISNDLRALAEDRRVAVDHMRIIPEETGSILLAGHTFVLSVTDEDARVEHHSRDQLVLEREQIIEQAITRYRQAREPWLRVRNVAVAILCWVIVALLLRASGSLNRRITARLHGRYERLVEARNLGAIHSLFGKQFQSAITIALRLATAIVDLVAIYIALSYSLSLLPETAGVSRQLFNSFRYAAGLMVKALIGYLPNLAVILLVIAATYCLIRIMGAFFGGIGRGLISVPGFHPEWVDPTNRILASLVIMFALVIIFPYLPGGDSPAFRGASIFVGVLVSLGSSSAMGNVIAGIILTYMRPFRVGDRVRISDTVGDVVERSLLVTRMRTVKNVDIIIPNSMILGAHILNYSAVANVSGLIVHTSVTIGYDAPWRSVHRLLIDAALATRGVMPEPRPYVLQTSLNDFHVSYEINAFTDRPNEMHLIGPELHKNIQDEFNRAGVEIMSPTYLSMRDGNTVTIPEAERPSGYAAPSFRVRMANGGSAPAAADSATR